MLSRIMRKEIAKTRSAVRQLSASGKEISASSSAAITSPKPTTSGGGSSFFQRLSSFLTGCGVGFGLSFYFLYQELQDSNLKLEREIKLLQSSVSGK